VLVYHHQRLTEPKRQSSLRTSWQIQPQLTIDTPQSFMIPPMTHSPQPIHVLPESPAGLRDAQCGQGFHHRRIASSPIDERPIVRGSTEPHSLTGPLNRKTALRHQMRDDLPPLNRP